MTEETVLTVAELGFPWQTVDPFLFCAHHLDAYPEGDEEMGPATSLAGRNLGMDFAGKDGWSMYHGQKVPGFPRHPHRGFETITIARSGYIDHSDSMGAQARFGDGDVQWMTAGKGVVHSEMFPLVHRDRPNPTELFQIWLNLPRADKMRDAYFTMFWNEDVPVATFADEAGKKTTVRVIAGALGDTRPSPPPPSSWASRPESDVAVWTLKLEPGAQWTAPPASAEATRVFYFFAGDEITLGGKVLQNRHLAQVVPNASTTIVNHGEAPAELLMLQGRPIGEPVVQHGPFVMSTAAEIQQTAMEFQRTGFGGWPFDNDAPVHPRARGRFAIHADGREENAGPNAGD